MCEGKREGERERGKEVRRGRQERVEGKDM